MSLLGKKFPAPVGKLSELVYPRIASDRSEKLTVLCPVIARPMAPFFAAGMQF